MISRLNRQRVDTIFGVELYKIKPQRSAVEDAVEEVQIRKTSQEWAGNVTRRTEDKASYKANATREVLGKEDPGSAHVKYSFMARP